VLKTLPQSTAFLVSSLPARRAERAGPHLHKPLTTASRANAANSSLRSNSGDGPGCLTARRGISHSQMCRTHSCVAFTDVSHSQTCRTHSRIALTDVPHSQSHHTQGVTHRVTTAGTVENGLSRGSGLVPRFTAVAMIVLDNISNISAIAIIPLEAA